MAGRPAQSPLACIDSPRLLPFDSRHSACSYRVVAFRCSRAGNEVSQRRGVGNPLRRWDRRKWLGWVVCGRGDRLPSYGRPAARPIGKGPNPCPFQTLVPEEPFMARRPASDPTTRHPSQLLALAIGAVYTLIGIARLPGHRLRELRRRDQQDPARLRDQPPPQPRPPGHRPGRTGAVAPAGHRQDLRLAAGRRLRPDLHLRAVRGRQQRHQLPVPQRRRQRPAPGQRGRRGGHRPVAGRPHRPPSGRCQRPQHLKPKSAFAINRWLRRSRQEPERTDAHGIR